MSISGRDLGPHLPEELELEPGDALLGAEDPALVLLELGGHVALRADEGLAAQVLGRHPGPVGVAHLDGVAEHAVEADLERRDAGAATLPLLEGGDPFLALARRVLELAQLLVPGLPDEPAIPQRQRRLVLESLFE